MFGRKVLVAAAALTVTAVWTNANAYEMNFPGWLQQPGVAIGASAGTPPPGIYMFDQVFVYPATLTGPGTTILKAEAPGTSKTRIQGAIETNGFLFVPGWNILGASYSALIVQPFEMASAGPPVNLSAAGIHNTYIVPIELSWRLGTSGLFVKGGFGMYVPDGTVAGASGLGNVGNPWWTFEPNLAVSYLKDGWNLTANFYEEFNTKNTITKYTTGDILHVELTATKTVGKWTFGPVGYYVGQVSDDKSSAFYGGAINVNRYNIWAAGALVGYNFGPATLNVWALDEVSANASGGSPVPGLTPDRALISKGFSVFASLSYRLWAPEEAKPAPAPKFHK
jgi:hypothetical protein